MADRQWFAEGVQVFETGEEEFFVEGVQVCEDQAQTQTTTHKNVIQLVSYNRRTLIIQK